VCRFLDLCRLHVEATGLNGTENRQTGSGCGRHSPFRIENCVTTRTTSLLSAKKTSVVMSCFSPRKAWNGNLAWRIRSSKSSFDCSIKVRTTWLVRTLLLGSTKNTCALHWSLINIKLEQIVSCLVTKQAISLQKPSASWQLTSC